MPTDFLNKTCKKKSKTEKVNDAIKFYIIRDSPGTKSQLKMKILNFWTKLINLHHRLLHIRISLSTKFQLKLAFLTFLIKGYFRSKTQKVNITTEL